MAPSLWQILWVVLFLALPAVGVWSENSENQIGRLHFLGVALGYSVGGAIVSQIVPAFGSGALFVVFAFYIVGGVYLARKVVQRGRQAGFRKGICYLYAVPVVGGAFALYLLFAPAKPQTVGAEELRETFS